MNRLLSPAWSLLQPEHHHVAGLDDAAPYAALSVAVQRKWDN